MISRILLIVGILCLTVAGFFTVQAYFEQKALEEELYLVSKANRGTAVDVTKPNPRGTTPDVPSNTPTRRKLKEGDLFGKLEVPRLKMSVMVMEGATERVLRLGAGRVPGAALAIAGHRDTFFRGLKDIKEDDVIRLTTPDGDTEYQVVDTRIVGPKDTWVLKSKSANSLTLITCYPFYYVGPAPKRFIVEATKK